MYVYMYTVYYIHYVYNTWYIHIHTHTHIYIYIYKYNLHDKEKSCSLRPSLPSDLSFVRFARLAKRAFDGRRDEARSLYVPRQMEHTALYAHTHTHINVCVGMRVYKYIYIYIFIFLCIYINIYIYIYKKRKKYIDRGWDPRERFHPACKDTLSFHHSSPVSVPSPPAPSQPPQNRTIVNARSRRRSHESANMIF